MGTNGSARDAARGMTRTTRLMMSGRLVEATAEIQRTLRGAATGGTPRWAGAFRPPTPGAFGPTGSGTAGFGGAGFGEAGFGGAGSGAAGRSQAGGSVTRGSVTGPSGALAYRLYVPTRPQQPAPLLVMLHGGTQDAETFAASTGMDEIAEREGILVAYPEQSRSANAMGYWNWFRPGDQQRGAGEPAAIAAVVTAVAGGHGIDRARVGVAGFSAGAAMAATLAATYPDVFCGAGVHSGLPYRAAHDVGSAFAAMSAPPSTSAAAGPVPLVVVHGDADRTVAPGNADAVVRSVLGSTPGEPEHTTGRVDGGRAWTRRRWSEPGGRVLVESWTVHGLGHDWSGGRAGASYADPSGPDAADVVVGFLGMRREDVAAATV